jgi:protein-S-isoprenylcysteine O-methyltransferase Ste14
MPGRRKIIIISGLCAAVAGALIKRHGNHSGASLPIFALDKPLLAHRQFLVAVTGWSLFSIYWDAAAKGASAAKSSESRASRGLHVFLTNAALLLVISPIRGLGRFLPASSLTMVAGLTVEAMGLFLAIWARRHLGRNWSGEITIKVEHQLIRSGPYGLLRHPIYTGLLAMYTGTTLVTGEWLAIIGLILAAFAYWRKTRLEEANLSVAFGAEYDAYRHETWALVPGLF